MRKITSAGENEISTANFSIVNQSLGDTKDAILFFIHLILYFVHEEGRKDGRRGRERWGRKEERKILGMIY